MSGSNLQGWRMASSVTEEDIKKLREARDISLVKAADSPVAGQTAEFAGLTRQLDAADADIALVNKRLDEAQDGAPSMETLRTELARAKEQARRSDAAALKVAEELRAERAARRQSEGKIAKMAIELKEASDRHELLEKESQAKAVDLKKVMVLLLQVPFQDDVFIVVWTVLLSGDRLVSFPLSVAVIGQRLHTMFAVRWFILLSRWVHVGLPSAFPRHAGTGAMALLHVMRFEEVKAATRSSSWEGDQKELMAAMSCLLANITEVEDHYEDEVDQNQNYVPPPAPPPPGRPHAYHCNATGLESGAMGQEGMGYSSGKAGGGGGGAPPMTAARARGASPLSTHHRSRKISRTFNNVKITVLCGLVTILVLRGTIGLNLSLPSQPSDADALAGAKAVEDIDRILREIRSDSDPSDPTDSDLDSSSVLSNATALNSSEAAAAYAAAVGNHALGPNVSGWDEQRRRWLAQNKGFPATVPGGKPRILLVTGSQPGPCDNPLGDHYLLKSTKNKIDYCRFHDIEIVHNLAHLDNELAGYWAKLPLLRRLMLSHPEVEWIWWMDSDALFTDMAFELPLSRYDNHNLIIHGYHDLLFEKHSWIALNTGSFLFRNCQWSLDLLAAWAPMGPKGFIREEAGKILTAYLKGRPAFEADDQSALIYLLLSQKEKWMDKVQPAADADVSQGQHASAPHVLPGPHGHYTL
ncbi:Putative glycosyltransferase 3 [Triticum urartu]|uniref:Putative glycosyltransferase 3 n=1 Tax=Triticum urartu TaxID=4572 RepID=M7ZC93_TRIUA|nr:Putative glycosyltransferase 3 [Triticum urartu]